MLNEQLAKANMSFTVNTANIRAYSYENPKCEHCASTTLIMQGTIYFNGSPQSMYSCANGHFTKGLTSSQQALVQNNSTAGLAATWVSNTGKITAAPSGTTDFKIDQVYQLKEQSESQTNEIRQLGQKFDRVALALETLIFKIDEAKLADPLASLTNRIRNFELK